MADARPEPFFIGGATGLDFLNSIATPVDAPVEWLASGDDLLEWLGHARLVTGETVAAVREIARPGELDGVAAQARALREWFRAFVNAHRGKPLKANALAELERLNQLLARDHEFERIALRTDGHAPNLPLQRARERRWSSPDALLLPIAEAVADFVCNENFADIKQCEGVGCSLIFVDQTRRHARRWCSMAVCGNRSKQSAHRERTSGR